MISIFLAKVFGLYLIIICVAVFSKRREIVQAISYTENNSFIVYITGAFLTLFGIVLINLHNIWTADYRGVITFLAWATLFKGLSRFYFGIRIFDIARSVFNSTWFSFVLALFLLVGIWLTGIGFGLF